MTKRLPQNYSARPRLGARAAGVFNNFPMYSTAFFEAAQRAARACLACLLPRIYRGRFTVCPEVNFWIGVCFFISRSCDSCCGGRKGFRDLRIIISNFGVLINRLLSALA